jgi:copper(I)-binding protein
MKRRAFILLPFAGSTALAHSQKHGGIKIGHAWAKPGVVGQDGHCFMPLMNTSPVEDALVAARSETCSVIQLRQNAHYDDPAEQQFALPMNKPLAMRPQATHLRLIGLSRNLTLGDRFSLILDFLNAGEVEIEVYVENSPGE